MFVVAARDTALLGVERTRGTAPTKVEQTGKSRRREQPGELKKQ
jgi:hypothetical protein